MPEKRSKRLCKLPSQAKNVRAFANFFFFFVRHFGCSLLQQQRICINITKDLLSSRRAEYKFRQCRQALGGQESIKSKWSAQYVKKNYFVNMNINSNNYMHKLGMCTWVFNDADLVYLRKVNIKSDIWTQLQYIIQKQTATYSSQNDIKKNTSATLVSSARCWIFII